MISLEKAMKYTNMFFLFMLTATVSVFAQKRAMTIEDLWSIRRIKEIAVSPDDRWIAFAATQYDMTNNSKETDIYIVSSNGGTSRRLTTNPASDSRPRWSPDGELLAFISERNGKPQIFVIPMAGGEAHQIAKVATGVDDFIWSPDGKHIAFISKIKLESDTSKDRDLTDVEARIVDKIPFRHWNRWLDNQRSHLFVMDITRETVWDITPGDYDTPPVSLGSHQDSLNLKFGLGQHETIDSVEVRWADKEHTVQVFKDIRPNSFIRISEGVDRVEYLK